MKYTAIAALLFFLSGCAYYDALLGTPDPQTIADYRKAVVVSEQTVTGLINAAKVAEHSGLIKHGSALEGAVAKSASVAVDALNGADKAAKSGDINAASVLYQTAKGAITGLQANIPGAAQ